MVGVLLQRQGHDDDKLRRAHHDDLGSQYDKHLDQSVAHLGLYTDEYADDCGRSNAVPDVDRPLRPSARHVGGSGYLPYTVLGANQLAPIFNDMVPDSVTGAQGFQLANGDTVILFATKAGPAWDQVIKAFTDTYGDEGREVTEYLGWHWGYLVASKVYAEDLAMLATIAYEVQDLEGALATAHDLFRATGPEDGLAEEYEVYSALIESVYNNALIVIEDTTAQPDSGLFSPPDAVRFMRNYHPELGDEIWSDFQTKNEKPSVLEGRFTLSVRYEFISKQEIESIFSKNASGWDDFYAKYPGSKGILTLSRVGFNEANDTAVLYAGNQSHWVAGEGNMVLMKKTAGRWTVQGEAMMWIS